MNARLSILIAILALALLTVQARATMLTFTNMGVPLNSPMPQDYGDNVADLPSGPGNPNTSYTYGTAHGPTPNVKVAYGTDPSVGGAAPVYYNGFGDLAESLNTALSGTVTFTADPGDFVKFYGFDFSTFESEGFVEKSINTLQIIVDGSTVFSATNVASPTSGHESFSSLPGAAPVYTGATIEILIDTTGVNNGYIGFRNFDFAQIVPEPASLGLLACGSLLLLRRRKR